MEQDGGDLDRNLEASAHKLERARRRGVVARGQDIGFLAMLVSLAIAAQLFGNDIAQGMMRLFQTTLGTDATQAAGNNIPTGVVSDSVGMILWPLAEMAIVLMIILLVAETVQIKGLLFSAQPLKPDFSRLNPVKGIKRLLSLRTLKEAAKNIAKFTVYAAGTVLLVYTYVKDGATLGANAASFANTIAGIVGRLLMLFLGLAAMFAILDQILVRREFARQMRMSKREMAKEHREREGDARQKQRRRQLHAEYMRQTSSLSLLHGSDVLLVNPQHYAVALRYDPAESVAPVVACVGRNLFAKRMIAESARLGITIVRHPALARALARSITGVTIDPRHYAAVAEIYARLSKSDVPNQ